MTVHGKIECLLPKQQGVYGYGAFARSVFKSLYDALVYFTGLGICEQTARYDGDTGGAGTGWSDDVAPFGENAWALFRFPPTVRRAWPWYVHMHWGKWTHVGKTPPGYTVDSTSHPALFYDTTGAQYENCGIQVARGIGSVNSIWNGTTLANGSDTKGTTPYWKVPSGGTRVAVLPRSNGIGGAHATPKHNFSPLIATDADGLTRLNVVTNGDALVIVKTIQTALVSSTAYEMYYLGALDTDPDLTDGALLLYGSVIPLPFPTALNILGDTAGATSNTQVGLDVAGYERKMAFDRIYSHITGPGTWHPNKVWSPNRYDLYKIPIMSAESGMEGLVGSMYEDLVTQAYGCASHTQNGDLSRVFFTDTGSTSAGIALAWDGLTTPGTGATRDGVTF